MKRIAEWFRQTGENLEFWRDEQPAGCRGCGCVFLLLVGLFFLAQFFGGLMGDYGGPTTPAALAEHNREMAAWFRNSLGGLLLTALVGAWWSRGSRR